VDKPDTQEQTVVAIDAANRFWVNGLEYPKDQFAEKVRSALEDKKEKVVLIKGDKDASYGAIMQAMDDLRKVQIEDIGLITEKKENKNAAGGGQ
jgi:biopolymer transport protein TolR